MTGKCVAPDILLPLLHVKRKRPSGSLCELDAVFSMLIYGWSSSLTLIVICDIICIHTQVFSEHLISLSQRAIDQEPLAKNKALACHLSVRRILSHSFVNICQYRCTLVISFLVKLRMLLGVISLRNGQCLYWKVLLACLLCLLPLGKGD